MLDWFLGSGSFKGSYNFHIEVQPRVLQSNSNLTVTCYSNKNKGAVIPVAITWFKLKNGLSTQMANVRGNTYLCEPSDIGAMIRAEIKSLDEQSNGTAIVDVGPVKIDIITKKNIEPILSSGAGNFTVFIVGKTRDRQGNLRIEDSLMRLKDVVTENCYKFEYTVSDPLIDLHPKDHTRMTLIFSERYEEDLEKFIRATLADDIQLTESRRTTDRYSSSRKIELRFSSRTTKDMFIYSYRAFVARREIKTSVLINKIENIDLNKQDNFNFLMEIESLKSDIARMMEVNKDHAKQKDIYHREIKHLEEEMERIILTYTRIVQEKCKNQQDFNQSYSVLTTKRDQIMSKKQKHLQDQNRQLTNKVAALNEQISSLRGQRRTSFSDNRFLQLPIRTQQSDFSKKEMPAADLQSKVIELSRINSVLVDQNAKLKQNGHQSLMVVKEKTIDNILQSLNDSIIRDNHDRLQEIVKKLEFQKANMSRQLEASNRKNQQLSQALKQAELKASSCKSVRLQVNKAPNSNVIHSMYINNTNDLNKLSNQLTEVKRLNEKLSNQNSRLQSIHNNDLSNCQAMQLEVTRMKEQMMSVSLDKSRAQFSVVVQSSEIQRLRKQRDQIATVKQMIEQKCDGLLIENSELKKKMLKLEIEIEGQKPKTAQDPEMNVVKSEIVSLKKQLADKEETILMLENTVQKNKDEQLNSSKSSEVSRLRRKAEQLLQENKLLRKGQDVLNRSRDLSVQMDSYYEQQNNVIKQQITMLTEQNERLVKMVEKYSKQAKQATKLRTEIIQLRSETLELKRQLQNKSTVNPQLSFVKQ